ncbi:ABC transporter ATP-binding protein [Paramaledivibacter caminithermalis]|jgi:ABC-2 type transport system ATP-binding protein|uniref:ABC-2 type transport system ATP-binding protein n=1 Tax=Paramaledivibacter caminithermalis (strain DSM 15212 / CIP 107654 / DViRD3) TaxID=1121301 RepID=A0A1M6RLC5_PARC5|nr:ABC transporter ATP-binding protein [Paramaledivibacter caminithermalis]SHK33226.1 ABC-2 type transport system ATP-binding protein [Paramaledivibacter caminithermalis DSM 15212]
MLKVSHICKTIENKNILSNISFILNDGDVLGIAGPNGAGKSTLISILSTIIKPTKGNISYYVNGDLYKGEKKDIIGYVPQDIALYEELNIKDNLLLFGSTISNDTRIVLNKATNIARALGLMDEFKTRVSKLSGGTKRRVNIAIGLIRDPKFVFMDEPVVGVDYRARRDIEYIISNMRSQGKIITITSHLIEFLENTCNKLLILENGKQKYFGDFDDEVKSKI